MKDIARGFTDTGTITIYQYDQATESLQAHQEHGALTKYC